MAAVRALAPEVCPPRVPHVSRSERVFGLLRRNEVVTGPGAYRIHASVQWVVDIPEGLQLRGGGMLFPFSEKTRAVVKLETPDGSWISFNADTGEEEWRQVRVWAPPRTECFFDQVAHSIRRGY